MKYIRDAYIYAGICVRCNESKPVNYLVICERCDKIKNPPTTGEKGEV